MHVGRMLPLWRAIMSDRVSSVQVGSHAFYWQSTTPDYCREIAENAAKGYSIKTGLSGTKRDLQFVF